MVFNFEGSCRTRTGVGASCVTVCNGSLPLWAREQDAGTVERRNWEGGENRNVSMFVLTTPQKAGSLIKKLSHTRIQVSLAASCDLTVDYEKREAGPREGGQHQEGVEALVLAHRGPIA